MAIALTRGDDSRLDGAPNSDLPAYADTVESMAIALLEEDDADGGPRFMGDINRARAVARAQVDAQLNAMRSRSAEAQARVAEDYGRRQQDRAQIRGVDPETMPYGASASDVRLANRPVAEASAQLEMEQNAADRVVRGLREGTPTFEDQEDLDFLRERGDMNPLAGPGKTDMAMRGAIRERRGQYYEMPDGSRIPAGREPTAAEIRSEREWQEWVNSQPGSERQALYDPVAYEQHRGGVRNDIRDSARADEAMYGTGSDDQLLNAAENGNRMAADQYRNRQARRQSEENVRNAQRGRFYRDKLMVDAGVRQPPPGPDAGIEDLERAAFRNRYSRRQAELGARKQARIDQAMMAGGQPTGGPFGTRATTTAINQLGPGWREIALLDRLTNGRVGGPTPLGVEQFQAQAIAQGVGRALTGALANMDPNATALAAKNAERQRQQQMYDEAEAYVSREFALPATITGASDYTIAEQDQTVLWLMARYGIGQAEAQSVVDGIAASRRAGAPPSRPAPDAPDAGLPPPGGRVAY